jgi:hypothetical protein
MTLVITGFWASSVVTGSPPVAQRVIFGGEGGLVVPLVNQALQCVCVPCCDSLLLFPTSVVFCAVSLKLTPVLDLN